MNRIKISLPDNPYEVLLGKDILGNLSEEFEKLSLYKNVFVIIDGNVKSKHHNYVEESFRGLEVSGYYEFESLESHKTFNSVQDVFKCMLDAGLSRDSVVIAIGGGIVGDVAGFISATYMRGVQYVQVPTTLLAAVDSSVGGKTGINFHDTKNVIGAFYQPKLVMIDTGFFSTLPSGEILCGIGEIVKYAFITNEEMFEYIEENLTKLLNLDTDTINYVIHESVSFKGDVVRTDEKESGIRKILNLGHTFAHAFEVQQKHNIKHGQAVIVGIACALYLSNILGIMTDDELDRSIKLIELFKDDIKLENFSTQDIEPVMNRDKKNRGGKIKFVLLKSIGEIIIDVEANWRDVEKAIQMGTAIFK
jgi:3-dehydroquinate synthase